MSDQTETLVKMINQIAENTPNYGDSDAVADSVAAHLRKFWAKPMKVKLISHWIDGGKGLNEIAKSAVSRLHCCT